MNTNKAIEILKAQFNLKGGDYVYIMTHKKDRDGMKNLIDLISGGLVNIYESSYKGALSYLVATDQTGIIYNVYSDKKIEEIYQVTNWDETSKYNVDRIRVDDVVYKKVRKVEIDD